MVAKVIPAVITQLSEITRWLPWGSNIDTGKKNQRKGIVM
jgi:hypothetical protein